MKYEKEARAAERLLGIMDELREKCPWDRKQTFESLRDNTIEETYELADALLNEEPEEIRGELGDLLLHIVFYSKIASEKGMFGFADVADAICDKLVYRHPHVFGAVQAANAEEVLQNWEQLKLKEKGHRKGVLSGVPAALPALVKAYRIGQKAAAAGFDWEKPADVWDKVREEISEVETEMKRRGEKGDGIEEEFGDLLFALVNAARLYGVDPETALEKTNRKFIRRFNYLENKCRETDRPMTAFSPGELEAFWQEAKKQEKEK